jgi:hypothetical protein
MSITLTNIARADALFKTSCMVNFSSVTTVVAPITSESPLFAPDLNGFSNSFTQIEAGEFTLEAHVMSGPPSGNDTGEFFEMNFFKGNPFDPSTRTDLKGLDLGNRPIGIPMTLTGIKLANTSINNQNVSAMNYSCSLVRVR